MDRENHILAAEDCRPLAQAFVPFADEAFLVTLANKGLYKRAVKDYETVAACALEVRGETLAVTLDDVCVTLDKTIANSSCSCPSKTVCKHILMALLCAAEFAAQETDTGPADAANAAGQADPAPDAAPAAVQEEPFSALRKADLSALRKQAGKRLFEDTLRLVQEGWTAAFSGEEMLTAAINTENVTVYFPKEDSINRAVCKCGTPGLCRHKLIAVLSYLGQNGLLGGVDGAEETAALLGDSLLELLRAADRFLLEVMEKGVVCAGENDVSAAAQFSIRLDAQGAGNLSRAFRRLSTDFENLLGKNASFDQIEVFGLLSRLHNTILLLLRSPGDGALVASLIEGNRSEYYTTPTGTFTGLGAYPWQTRSGYFGITALLYHHEKQRVCTYTASMADYYEHTAGFSNLQSLKMLFERNEHWAAGLSLKTISTERMTLGNYKSNLQNRISTGKQTACTLRGKTNLADAAGLSCARAPADLPPSPQEAYSYFTRKRPEELFAIRATCLIHMAFDRVDQVLRFGISDAQGSGVNAELPFSELNEPAIRYLEQLGKRESFSERYFICLRRHALIPVSIVSESGVKNFYFG